MVYDIRATLNCDKTIVVTKTVCVVRREDGVDRITLQAGEQFSEYDCYFEFDCPGIGDSRIKLLSPKIAVQNGVAEYLLPQKVLRNRGRIYFQFVARRGGESPQIFRSVKSGAASFEVDEAILASDGVTRQSDFFEQAAQTVEQLRQTKESVAELILQAESTLNDAKLSGQEASAIAQELLQDKENGFFRGEKGEKGDDGSMLNLEQSEGESEGRAMSQSAVTAALKQKVPAVSQDFFATVNLIYPVGSIYMSVTAGDPAGYFGGVWERWGKGRVPLSLDEDDAAFASAECVGGEKTHLLEPEELPKHAHYLTLGKVSVTVGGTSSVFSTSGTGQYPTTSVTGLDRAHNNLQPFITCYMWKRVS